MFFRYKNSIFATSLHFPLHSATSRYTQKQHVTL